MRRRGRERRNPYRRVRKRKNKERGVGREAGAKAKSFWGEYQRR